MLTSHVYNIHITIKIDSSLSLTNFHISFFTLKKQITRITVEIFLNIIKRYKPFPYYLIFYIEEQ